MTTSEMKSVSQMNSSEDTVELTFTTNEKDVVNCNTDISGRVPTECWVEFPEFLLDACKDFQQTPKGTKFLDLLTNMTEGCFNPKVICQKINKHQANPITLVASRRFITSAFGVTKINNKYITAISVPQNDTPYVWFIIIKHENCLEYCLNYLGVLIDELLTEIYYLLRKLIRFIDIFLRDLLECLYLLFIFILTLIGGFIMPPRIRSEPRKRPTNQFKAFNIIFSILEFLKEISTKLNDLKEVNERLIKLDEKVAHLNENSDVIMQNMNDINNTSLMSRYEEIIKENQYLQMQAQEKDEIINKQRKYIEELANEIEQISKYLPSEKNDNKTYTINEINEFSKIWQNMRGKVNNIISHITSKPKLPVTKKQ